MYRGFSENTFGWDAHFCCMLEWTTVKKNAFQSQCFKKKQTNRSHFVVASVDLICWSASVNSTKYENIFYYFYFIIKTHSFRFITCYMTITWRRSLPFDWHAEGGAKNSGANEVGASTLTPRITFSDAGGGHAVPAFLKLFILVRVLQLKYG